MQAFSSPLHPTLTYLLANNSLRKAIHRVLVTPVIDCFLLWLGIRQEKEEKEDHHSKKGVESPRVGSDDPYLLKETSVVYRVLVVWV